MSKSLAVNQKHEIISKDQFQTLKNTIAKGATDAELELFSLYCNRTGLDPFSNQIHFIKRGDKPTFQTSIDGLRLIAERSEKYRGQTKVEWCGEDGEWVDVWLKPSPPAAAKVGVLRSDFAEPLVAVAKYKSYAVTVGPMWAKMPEVMIAKVAEALALRKAFPNDMAGLYTGEEMDQADAPTVTVNEPRQVVEQPIEPEILRSLTQKEIDEAYTGIDKCETTTDLGAHWNKYSDSIMMKDEEWKAQCSDKKAEIVRKKEEANKIKK